MDGLSKTKDQAPVPSNILAQASATQANGATTNHLDEVLGAGQMETGGRAIGEDPGGKTPWGKGGP